MQKREFGHKHLDSIYGHIITIDDNGFEYKKKYYVWKNIVKVKVLEPLEEEGLSILESPTFERLRIYLFDGQRIKINSKF